MKGEILAHAELWKTELWGSLVMNTCGDPWVSVLRLNLALDALAPKVR
jgi:hypothetical protein